MHYEWQDRLQWRASPHWKRGAELGISEALYALSEVFELAERLSNTPAGDDRMRVAINVGGIRDRMLVVDDPRRHGIPRADHVATIDVFLIEGKYSRAELLTNAGGRFNWDIPVERLSDWLESLRSQR